MSWTSQTTPLYHQYAGLCDSFVSRFFVSYVSRTCFFVLGLIASTSQGAEVLDDYEWEATLSPQGQAVGLCIPLDVEKFISVRLSVMQQL